MRTSGTSTVTVAPTAGHTVSGTGSIQGIVTIATGATLAPGNSIGTMTLIGDATLTIGGTVALELGPDGTGDRLVVSGNLNLSAAGDALSLTGGEPGRTYEVIDVGGTLTGAFDAVTPGYAVAYDPAARQMTVTVTAVPEPGGAAALALLGAGAARGLSARRRRPPDAGGPPGCP